MHFPVKLYELVDTGNPKIIAWCEDGEAFRIVDPDAFCAEILPQHFRHNKLTSFQRQLNLYGFHRILNGVNAGGYSHPKFKRGRLDMLGSIKREVRKTLNRHPDIPKSPTAFSFDHTHASFVAGHPPALSYPSLAFMDPGVPPRAPFGPPASFVPPASTISSSPASVIVCSPPSVSATLPTSIPLPPVPYKSLPPAQPRSNEASTKDPESDAARAALAMVSMSQAAVPRVRPYPSTAATHPRSRQARAMSDSSIETTLRQSLSRQRKLESDMMSMKGQLSEMYQTVEGLARQVKRMLSVKSPGHSKIEEGGKEIVEARVPKRRRSCSGPECSPQTDSSLDDDSNDESLMDTNIGSISHRWDSRSLTCHIYAAAGKQDEGWTVQAQEQNSN